MSLDLHWLPVLASWKDLLEAARKQPPLAALNAFQRLANSRMDFVRAGQLDKAVQRYLEDSETPREFPTLRLALLGSSTLTHLLPGIRLAALRRGILLEVYVGAYGMYRQELADTSSALHGFRPEVVCFCFDAQHLVPSTTTAPDAVLQNLLFCWKAAQAAFSCSVIQQTGMPRFPLLLGNHEDRLPGSQAGVLHQVNEAIHRTGAEHGVSVLALDRFAALSGVEEWFDPALWYSAKQEVHPRASGVFGDQLGRLIGALRGQSAKCLVLDLDNTLWGGVIGDDGLDGIVLGQGSAAGEAFLAFQRYAVQLRSRGIILAVCSKNDHANAIAPFETHPDMCLKSGDIACFVANWQDKATNLRHIAATLSIGLDSLVFVDDNPAERELIRRELPMVSVPELPEEPAGYVRCLSDAGYFEALAITAEDRQRGEMYQANAGRAALLEQATDLPGYLKSLGMQLTWSNIDAAGLKRAVQLINKTNQFNLTTKRYLEGEVAAMLNDPSVLTLQLRLTDVYGDNGVIGVILGRRDAVGVLTIDTWLMSCRVLGRGVEDAALNVLCGCAREMKCSVLFGTYRPTAKNSMVRDLYGRLGFEQRGSEEDQSTFWDLPLDRYVERPTYIQVIKGEPCPSRMSMAS